MEIKSKYKKEDVDNKFYIELVSYCNSNGKKIDSDNEYFYILEQWENIEGGVIVSRKIAYDEGISRREKELELERLKKELEDSDYKVIKCYEISLIGGTMPYDVVQLHQERQSIRDAINKLID